MKKLILAVWLVTVLLFIASISWAAGTVTVTKGFTRVDGVGNAVSRTLVFTCVGDSSDGSIPNTSTGTALSDGSTPTTWIKGWYLYRVISDPGAVAPDAADVFVLDANSIDLLGSEDNGTTAYNGLNLIHATLSRTAIPNMYIPRGGEHINFYPEITGDLTLKVSNQATVSATYVITLVFVK